PLAITWQNDGTGAQAVLVLQLALQHVGDDFHVVMRVGREARRRSHVVLIDHPQGPESHPARIPIVTEAEAVLGVQPSVIASASLIAASHGNHRPLSPTIIVMTIIK